MYNITLSPIISTVPYAPITVPAVCSQDNTEKLLCNCYKY